MFSEEYIIKQVIKDISFNLHLHKDQIEMDTKISDLCLDSLDKEDIIYDLEESFDIEIFIEDFDRFKTVRDLVNYIMVYLELKR